MGRALPHPMVRERLCHQESPLVFDGDTGWVQSMGTYGMFFTTQLEPELYISRLTSKQNTI